MKMAPTPSKKVTVTMSEETFAMLRAICELERRGQSNVLTILIEDKHEELFK